MKIDPKKLAMILHRVQLARAMAAPQGGAPMAPGAPAAPMAPQGAPMPMRAPMPPGMMPR